jgi:hypothetical protein
VGVQNCKESSSLELLCRASPKVNTGAEKTFFLLTDDRPNTF